MSRPLRYSDLLPGDFLAMRSEYVAQLPPGDPTRMACEAILAGQSLIVRDPRYYHIAVLVDAPTDDVIEELPQGQVEDRENILLPAYDIIRATQLDTPEKRAAFIAAERKRLKQRYGYECYVEIAAVRLLGVKLDPAYSDPTVCSGAGAISLAEVGVFPWKSRVIAPQFVMPADYADGEGLVYVGRAGVYVEAST